MLYYTKDKLITRIPVINTLKEKDNDTGWNKLLELQIVDVKKGSVLDIYTEFQTQNESPRLRDKSIRITSKITGKLENHYSETTEKELLEKGGQNICADCHYWLQNRRVPKKNVIMDKDYLSVTISLWIKAAMQGAKKDDYAEIGKCCWMEVEI